MHELKFGVNDRCSPAQSPSARALYTGAVNVVVVETA